MDGIRGACEGFIKVRGEDRSEERTDQREGGERGMEESGRRQGNFGQIEIRGY